MQRSSVALVLCLFLSLGTVVFAEDDTSPKDEKPEIHALELPGLKEMNALKNAQDQAVADSIKINALIKKIPFMKEDQALKFARQLGWQLNQVFLELYNNDGDPYRRSGEDNREKLKESAKEIVVLATMALDQIDTSRRDGISAGVGAGVGSATVLATILTEIPHVTFETVFSSIIIGFVSGGIVTPFTYWWKTRKFRKAFKEAFENELDPEFKRQLRLEFKPERYVAYLNLLKTRECALQLLEGQISPQLQLPDPNPNR